MSLRLEFLDFTASGSDAGSVQRLGDVPPGQMAVFEAMEDTERSTFFILACLKRAQGDVYAQVHRSDNKDFVQSIPRGGLNESTLVHNIVRFGAWREIVTSTEGETGLLRATFVPDTYAVSPWQPISDQTLDLP